ncbi:MAG: heme ABC transporter ATP-binding protein [Desulfitobacteriia bacterium]|jgi:iron complex transport system ATP-binding protein
MERYLTAEQLSFSYDQNPVFKDLNLEITKGSFITIIGPNGSGKSTLLKNISAEYTPQKGAVFLEAQNLLAINKKHLAREMAVVPQDSTGEFSFSVWETVLMGRIPHQKKFQPDSREDLAITRRAMELTNVWHLRERFINELSGGEKQRVIVARALAQSPKIILLDEPTSHLDLQHQLELLELLSNLNKTQGLTVIAVLHDLNLAAQYSQKIILLNRGKIIAYGDPSQVLTTENIKESYHIEVAIAKNEITGRFNIIPLRLEKETSKHRNLKIHLVCGGGSGGYLMDQLVHSGYTVSCGVLNIGDSDWKKARELGLKIAEEKPFAPISTESQKANAALIAQAEVIIILPVPFGVGNIANLKQVVNALQEGQKKVLIVEQDDFSKRDFTGGAAEKLLEELYSKGALGFQNLTDVIENIGGN